jgi:signal transduction histidine kinase/DNA-binding response OmpR family regulator
VDDFIPAPVSDRELLARVQRVTSRNRARRRAEDELRESERKTVPWSNKQPLAWAVSVLTTRNGLTSTRPSAACSAFIEVNQAFEKQSGLLNVLGKWMRELRPDHEEIWFQLYGDVALSGRPVRTEAQSQALGRWFSIYAFRIGSPEQRRVAVLFSDITQRKQVEESLRRLNKTLELRVARRTAVVRRQADHLRALAAELSRAEQSERKRLATILHDHIQQLLVAARLQLDCVKREITQDQKLAAVEDANEMLRQAIEASRSLMLDLSPPVLHHSGLIGGLRWLASRMQQQYQLTVELNLNSNAEPVAEEIRFLLFECVRELLFNTVKHANVQQAKVSLAKLKNNRLRLIVSDKGNGFDPSLLEHRRPEELTFGLFGIQERLAHLGGRMKIESAPGKGTAITLNAPDRIGKRSRQQAALETKGGKAGSPHTPHPRTHKCRVLIVDDHKIMREGLAGLLQFQSEIEIVGEAADGPEAIELAWAVDPDVIIMDVNLGAMSGIEATRRILANNPRPRIIGLSMHSDPSIAEAMRAAGAAYYLTKGGPAEDLIAAILSATGR